MLSFSTALICEILGFQKTVVSLVLLGLATHWI